MCCAAVCPLPSAWPKEWNDTGPRRMRPGARTGRGSRLWSAFGLILARRIVERHGGRLWVDACPEIGATVYFTVVPAAAAQDLVRAAFG